MRILLTLLLVLLIELTISGCGASKPVLTQSINDMIPNYQIVIRILEGDNVVGKIMDVFNRNGMRITKVQQTYFSTERQEIRITIKDGSTKALNEVEYQVRSVVNVESISITRL